jgi:hypothetical protein
VGGQAQVCAAARADEPRGVLAPSSAWARCDVKLLPPSWCEWHWPGCCSSRPVQQIAAALDRAMLEAAPPAAVAKSPDTSLPRSWTRQRPQTGHSLACGPGRLPPPVGQRPPWPAGAATSHLVDFSSVLDDLPPAAGASPRPPPRLLRALALTAAVERNRRHGADLLLRPGASRA